MKEVGSKTKQQKPWFKTKKYGYGWGVPQTWQGWLALGGWLLIGGAPLVYVASYYKGDTYCSSVLQQGVQVDCNPNVSTGMYVLSACLWLAAATLGLFMLSSRYSEKPKWQWGSKTKKGTKRQKKLPPSTKN